MRTTIYLTTILLIILSGQINAQKYSLYSNDTLVIHSKFLQSDISIKLHLPETFHFSSSQTTYPISIIFDSQHERTYPQIINSFDLLTSELQIPEMIMIGIPFTIENRYYLTSNKKKVGDSLSGIERMELFLFNELIPQLQKEKKANDFVTICGHSRTGFLVNYLSLKRPKEISVAISLSGFYSEPPISINKFSDFILNPNNFKRKFAYYASSGSTLEEKTYLKEYQAVFPKTPYAFESDYLKIQFKQTEFANHMTNYWLSVPEILVGAFTEYNFILDNWFHNKLKENEKLENPKKVFVADLKFTSTKLGFNVNPSITHIFSLMSHFGYQNKDYKTAIEFLNLGLEYYPEYLEFYMELINFYKILEQTDKVKEYKNILKYKVQSNKYITEALRSEITAFLNDK